MAMHSEMEEEGRMDEGWKGSGERERERWRGQGREKGGGGERERERETKRERESEMTTNLTSMSAFGSSSPSTFQRLVGRATPPPSDRA